MALSVSETSIPQKNNNGEIQEIDVFRRFDVVSDSSDHHYVDRINHKKLCLGDCFTNVASEVLKKIMQEWKILEKHLPDTIFVRAYENRIDLLRAVIGGAGGTPYHDGLYFFDIAFPSDYPTRPPFVSYRSFGLRINPNLYADGVVCLSLLNTWYGKKKEKWSPKESTVLQLLVSIQALVLNEKPYFNEPGIGLHTWDKEKSSSAYNEDVFLLSCKTMMHLLRSPPKNFEGFVAGHFRKRAHVILSASNAYTEGRVKVGYYSYGNDTMLSSSSSRSSKIGASYRFKRSMEKLYPDLVEAFTLNGASLGTFDKQLQEEKNIVVVKKEESRNAKRALGKFIKKVLGLGTQKKTKSDVSSVRRNTTASS